MGKESKGFLAFFKRDKRERKPNESPKRRDNSRSNMDRLQKLSRLLKCLEAQEKAECREPTMAETYDMMCKSLEQFRINATNHSNEIDTALAKYTSDFTVRPEPDRHRSVRITSDDVLGVVDHAIRRDETDRTSSDLKDAQPNVNDPMHIEDDDGGNINDNSPPADVGVEQEGTGSQEESRDIAEENGIGRFDGNVIDIHELLESEYRGKPVSEYCQRYLDLANHIPSLVVLCKAEIKAIICDKIARTRTPETDFICKVSGLEELYLPQWLEHKSLVRRWPPYIAGQLAHAMLSGNHNNNHPALSADESEENNNGIVVSKSKYNESVPITTEQSLDGESSTNGRKTSRTNARSSSRSTERRTGRRKTDRYYLVPVGSCSTQGLPAKGYHKWMDVATIIHQGTYEHRNLKPTRYTSPLTTLPQEQLTPVLAKLKCYSLRPLKPLMTSLKTLMEVNEIRRIFAETHAKFVCVNILLALQFLHNHGLFHGSISPAKIIFNDKGYPCLTGFGTADIIEGRQGRPRERQDVCYMSPEQIYLDYVTEATDFFSLGAVIYAMVYGKPPHQGPDYASSRRNVLTHKFEPRFSPEEMSSEGKHFVKKCIRKDDRRRPSLLHMKKSLTESVEWFERLHEEKLYRQAIPSPILHVIKNL